MSINPGGRSVQYARLHDRRNRRWSMKETSHCLRHLLRSRSRLRPPRTLHHKMNRLPDQTPGSHLALPFLQRGTRLLLPPDIFPEISLNNWEGLPIEKPGLSQIEFPTPKVVGEGRTFDNPMLHRQGGDTRALLHLNPGLNTKCRPKCRLNRNIPLPGTKLTLAADISMIAYLPTLLATPDHTRSS